MVINLNFGSVASTCRNIWQSVYVLLTDITIEPVIFFFSIPHLLLVVSTSNLFLEKACRLDLTLNDTLCDSIVTGESLLSENDEVQLQQEVTFMTAWTSVIQGAVPGFLVLYFGALNDRCDIQKFFIILPFTGEALRVTSFLISSYFFDKFSLNLTGFLNSFFHSISGGMYIFLMAAFNYIGITSTKESRTFRFGVITICSQISATIGLGLGGLSYRKLTLNGTFWMCLSLYAMGVVYVIFCLKKIPIKTQEVQSEKSENKWLSKIFEIAIDIKSTLMTVFQKRNSNLRLKICLNVLIIILINGVSLVHTFIYFIVRKRYNWNEIKFSNFAMITFAANSVGNFFGLVIFAKYLNINDNLLAMIPCVLQIVAFIMSAFATNEVIFYCSIVFGMFYGITTVSTRSILTKLVSENELGKINGIIGSCQTFMPLFFGPAFNIIYRYTVHIHDGIIFLVAGIFLIPVIAILIWQYQNRKYEKFDDNEIVQS